MNRKSVYEYGVGENLTQTRRVKVKEMDVGSERDKGGLTDGAEG